MIVLPGKKGDFTTRIWTFDQQKWGFHHTKWSYDEDSCNKNVYVKQEKWKLKELKWDLTHPNIQDLGRLLPSGMTVAGS